MKFLQRILPICLLAAAAVAPAMAASNTNPARSPIRPISDCLNLGQPYQAYAPSNKTVIVKNGPKYYRIDLANDCPNLSAGTLKFHIAADKRDMQRMCGELGDQIINRSGLHCDVKSVKLIDQQQFDALQAQSKARQ